MIQVSTRSITDDIRSFMLTFYSPVISRKAIQPDCLYRQGCRGSVLLVCASIYRVFVFVLASFGWVKWFWNIDFSWLNRNTRSPWLFIETDIARLHRGSLGIIGGPKFRMPRVTGARTPLLRSLLRRVRSRRRWFGLFPRVRTLDIC